MDTNQHHQTSKIKAVDKKNNQEEEEEEEKQSSLAASKQNSPTSPTAAASPPSATSSPSHEFSFTISLHSSSSSSTTTTTVPDNNISNNKYKTKTTPPSFAIDLSPADEIFFHGHLLPLHLLSHLPASPRSSTNSLDSFTLPIRDLTDDQKPERKLSNSNNNSSISNIKTCDNHHHQQTNNNNLDQTKGRAKSKSFSLFGFTRWQKGNEERERQDNDNKDQINQKKKLRFDVSNVIKRYVRMIRPLLHFRGRRENGHHFQRQPYSFSGNLSFRNKQQDQLIRGRRRGEFSAPASIRTSPTNSGLLVATTNIPSSTSDSTMEELQAAIQAAIAHCKNSSTAVEEKLKR